MNPTALQLIGFAIAVGIALGGAFWGGMRAVVAVVTKLVTEATTMNVTLQHLVPKVAEGAAAHSKTQEQVTALDRKQAVLESQMRDRDGDLEKLARAKHAHEAAIGAATARARHAQQIAETAHQAVFGGRRPPPTFDADQTLPGIGPSGDDG